MADDRNRRDDDRIPGYSDRAYNRDRDIFDRMLAGASGDERGEERPGFSGQRYGGRGYSYTQGQDTSRGAMGTGGGEFGYGVPGATGGYGGEADAGYEVRTQQNYGRDHDDRHPYGGRNYGGGYTPNPRGDGNRDDLQRRLASGARGFLTRAGDEIASWFGSDDAENRRERDARQGDQGARHHVDQGRQGSVGQGAGYGSMGYGARSDGGQAYHTGRGPKGYSRSDERIQDDVAHRLTLDPYVDATDVDITVQGGEVTLTGHVDGRLAKRRAEDVADEVPGVRHVQNNLRIRDRTPGGLTGL